MRASDYTVLAIEDDQELRRGIAAFFNDLGFRVLEAENGHKGLEMFERAQPDLVLTDLKMPMVDGFAVILTITQRSPEVPVVAISGTGVVNDVVEAFRCGAWDFITKPIGDLKELEIIVGNVLEKSRRVRSTAQRHI